MNNTKKYDEMVRRSPQYKMGIKVLSVQQLKSILPDYRNIENKIRKHREFIQEHWGKNEKEHQDEQINLMFDNVYSILGERGSGKTSAIYTLKKKWEEEQQGDIFLPIIMTEIIPKKFSIIGWILSLLESTVRELDCNLKRQKDYCSKEYFEECAYNKKEKGLLNQYEDLKACYFSNEYKSDSENEGFSAVAFNSGRMAQNVFDFSRKLSDFWTCLKKAKMKVDANKEQRDCGGEGESLIYIMFDDVDLAPDKVWELLSTIVKYLSHPNVIVLMTADETMLYEVVKNELYLEMKNEKLNDEMTTSQKWIEKTARQYLGKILPPSTRYYILNFNTCREKADFIQEIQVEEDKVNPIKVKEFLSNKMKEYGTEDILYWGNNFIYAYLLFFGNTSRQIENECLIMSEFFDDLKSLREEYPDDAEQTGYLLQLYHSVVKFAVGTLHASHSMNISEDTIEELTRKLLCFQPDDWGIYINYSYLQERFEEVFYVVNIDLANAQKDNYGSEAIEDENHAEKVNEALHESIKLYILLFFIENILIVEQGFHENSVVISRKKVHGLFHLVSMLDTVTPKEAALVCNENSDKRAKEFLYTYGTILEQPDILQDFNVYVFNKVKRYLRAIPNDIDVEMEFEECDRKHPKWIKTMISVLFLANEEIYCIDSREIKLLSISNEQQLYDEGVDKLEDDLQSYLRDKLIGSEMSGTGNAGYIDDKISKIYTDAQTESYNDKKVSSVIKFIEDRMKKEGITYGGICNWYCVNQFENLGEMQKEIQQMLSDDGTYRKALFMMRAELMRLKSTFEFYKITSTDDFKRDIGRIEKLTASKAPTNIRETDGKVQRKRMNNYLKSVLQAAYQDNNRYFYEDDEQLFVRDSLNDLFYNLRDLLQVDLDGVDDVSNIVDYIFLSKVYVYVEGEYLKKYVENQSAGEIFSDLLKDKIPYKKLYKQIEAVRQSSNKKDYYMHHNTDELIKDTVTQYLELLYKSQS